MRKKDRDRWKCPDCSGWVRDDIEVHKCEVTPPSNILPWGGWTCALCGSFISWNNYHSCWTYTTPPPPVYYYTTTTSNNTGINTTYTTTPTEDDDGSVGAVS